MVDPSELNWLYITYNTVEELVRLDPAGNIEPAAMSDYRWIDDRALEVATSARASFSPTASRSPLPQ